MQVPGHGDNILAGKIPGKWGALHPNHPAAFGGGWTSGSLHGKKMARHTRSLEDTASSGFAKKIQILNVLSSMIIELTHSYPQGFGYVWWWLALCWSCQITTLFNDVMINASKWTFVMRIDHYRPFILRFRYLLPIHYKDNETTTNELPGPYLYQSNGRSSPGCPDELRLFD